MNVFFLLFFFLYQLKTFSCSSIIYWKLVADLGTNYNERRSVAFRRIRKENWKSKAHCNKNLLSYFQISLRRKELKEQFVRTL
jgi:hypothetical protein